MIGEWLIREGGIVLNWWLLVTAAGVAVLPLSMHLLRGLPDRGYTLARALGLLLVGFVFWLMASLGLVRNTPGGILLAWLLVLAGGLAVSLQARDRVNWSVWWRENRMAIITGEILFVLMLLGFALYRAHMPNLTGTEKPMELAFMSAVLRSEAFPPNDPWLSGYAISYYYFGYVLTAMLTMLSGISSAVGFNMMVALLFALTGLTVFGVVYNLTRWRVQLAASARGAVGAGIIGVLLLVLMGNFQLPLIELPYQTLTADDAYLAFWGQDARLTVKDAAAVGTVTDLSRWDFWWWFRASRVVTDVGLDGIPIGIQPIDEFPSFSFVLSDVHPHVLALPFAVLALGLALNVTLGVQMRGAHILLYGVVLGGLIFLNTWDGPIYLVIFVAADALRRMIQNGNGRLLSWDWWALARLGGSLLAVAIIAYLPFFISFRSQASGILPNALFPTRFQQIFVMFGPFILLIGAFMLLESWLARGRMNWRPGVAVAVGILLVLILVAGAMIGLAALLPQQQVAALQFIDAQGGLDQVLPALLSRRLETAPTLIMLLVGLVVVVARLFPPAPRLDTLTDAPREARQVVTYTPTGGFALLLVAAGCMLVLAPEYVYLRDNFGVRINTIFKFYYQAWLLFSVAAAYGVYMIVADERLRGRLVALRGVMTAMIGVVLLLGLMYPVLAYQNRALVESGRAMLAEPALLTLDGGPTLVGSDDYQAIMCLGAMVKGSDAVVAEAIGPAYNSGYGRVGALTGIPILLGWENHQGQWRGATYPAAVGTRATDVPELYSTLRWEIAQSVIDRYGIDYIFYGSSERQQYGVTGEDKFMDNLTVVCEYGNSRFYRVDPVNQR